MSHEQEFEIIDPAYKGGFLDISDALVALEEEKNRKLSDGIYKFKSKDVKFKRTKDGLKMISIFFNIYHEDGTKDPRFVIENFIVDALSKQQVGTQRLQAFAVSTHCISHLQGQINLKALEEKEGHCVIKMIPGTYQDKNDGAIKDCMNPKIQTFIDPSKLNEFIQNEKNKRIMEKTDFDQPKSIEDSLLEDNEIPF